MANHDRIVKKMQKNYAAYEKSQIKYWVNKLRKKGYTVIEPGGTEK